VQAKKPSRVINGIKYLKTILIEAAWAASHAKTNPALVVKHRSIAARGEVKKTNLAIGHKILIAAYHVLRHKTCYATREQNNKYISKEDKRKSNN